MQVLKNRRSALLLGVAPLICLVSMQGCGNPASGLPGIRVESLTVSTDAGYLTIRFSVVERETALRSFAVDNSIVVLGEAAGVVLRCSPAFEGGVPHWRAGDTHELRFLNRGGLFKAGDAVTVVAAGREAARLVIAAG